MYNNDAIMEFRRFKQMKLMKIVFRYLAAVTD